MHSSERSQPGLRYAFALLSWVALASCAPADGGDGAGETALDSTLAITRDQALARAGEWVSARLHYCQSPNHARDYDSACSAYCERTDNPAWNPYRSDCSGLVSWAWRLPAPGRVTWDFAPYANDITHAIPASELQPGDAVNNREHVMLFKGWNVRDHSATFVEEPGCSSATPYAHEFTSTVSVSGDSIYVSWNGMTFTAIRYDHIVDSTPTPTPSPTTEPVPPASTVCGIIEQRHGLAPGHSIRSCDGHHELIMQTDGNLVLYHDGRATWASHTEGRGGYVMWMQTDGNVVVYDRTSQPLWAAGTYRHPGAFLAIQDDGNLVVYESGHPLWASDTWGR